MEVVKKGKASTTVYTIDGELYFIIEGKGGDFLLCRSSEDGTSLKILGDPEVVKPIVEAINQSNGHED